MAVHAHSGYVRDIGYALQMFGGFLMAHGSKYYRLMYDQRKGGTYRMFESQHGVVATWSVVMSMPRATLQWGSGYELRLGVSQNYIVSCAKWARYVSERTW